MRIEMKLPLRESGNPFAPSFEGWAEISQMTWGDASALAFQRMQPVRMVDENGLVVRELHPLR